MIDNNDLTTIQEGTFADLTNLLYVDLNLNPIDTLEIGTYYENSLMIAHFVVHET